MLLPAESRNTSSTASLDLAITGGPRQAILRPVEIEKPALAGALIQRALFGEHRLFDLALGMKHGMQGAVLVLQQERGARVSLNEEGSVSLSILVQRTGQMGMELIEEDIQGQYAAALDYASWVLDHIDPTQRLSQVAIITGGEYMAWRTRRESDAGRNSGMSMSRGGNEQVPVQVNQTRSALRLNAAHIVEDLLVPLRRQRR